MPWRWGGSRSRSGGDHHETDWSNQKMKKRIVGVGDKRMRMEMEAASVDSPGLVSKLAFALGIVRRCSSVVVAI